MTYAEDCEWCQGSGYLYWVDANGNEHKDKCLVCNIHITEETGIRPKDFIIESSENEDDEEG